MKICLVCEGCYPYVMGGVSSWIQQLIKSFPQHEFIIYAIGADAKQKGKFLYSLPENVSGVTEIFLNDAFLMSSFEGYKETPIRPWEISEFKKLMNADFDKWESVFDFFHRGRHIVASFLMSSDFYDIVYELYEKRYSHTMFVDFLWTMRSMYLTLFHVLNNPPPKADLYHAVSTGYAGIAATLAKRIHGGGMAITEHGIYSREREEEIITADWVKDDFKALWIDYFKNLSVAAYIASDKIIALFESNNKIQIENGADPLKCSFIANGINYKSYDNLDTKKPENVINVGAIIRVTPIKDIKTMLYAFDIVKRKVPNAVFYLMGPTEEAPEYYEECTALLKEIGTNDVIFTGRINVKDYIGKMDVMVLTSISEAQPLSLMEAMAARVACVSTNVGCCSELFNGTEGDELGVAGFLAPIMNYEKIANAIIKIIKDPDLKQKMGEAGRKRIEKFYSEQKFKDAYTELYGSFEKKFIGKKQD